MKEKLLCIVDTAFLLKRMFLSIYLTEQPHTILSYYFSLVVGKVFSEALVLVVCGGRISVHSMLAHCYFSPDPPTIVAFLL